MTGKEMWREYKKINIKAEKYDTWTFGGNSPDAPNFLANLVLKGVKTATSSAYDSYIVENSPIPKKGDYSVILDKEDNAVCIIKTSEVYIIPFYQVTEEHAFKEGEFDRSLLTWKKCHQKFFTTELKSINKQFSEDMIVVCEEFKVVYPIK